MKKIFCLLIFISAIALQSNAETFYIDLYNVTVKIDKHGFFDVTEVIEANFTEDSHGIIRKIPTEYIRGENLKTIKLSSIKVKGARSDISETNGFQIIKIGDPEVLVSGKQTYTIKYRVTGAFQYGSSAHDELYWDLIGNEWDVQINQMNFEIKLPYDYIMQEQITKIWTGKKGEKNRDAIIKKEGKRIFGSTTKVLDPNESVTAAIKFPKAYIRYKEDLKAIPADRRAKSETANKGAGFKWKDFAFPIPLSLMGLFFLFWNKQGKNKKINIGDEDVFYPPENLTPPEVGAFIDYVVHDQDVISLVPYWAQKGYLRIEPVSDDDYQITKIKNLSSSDQKLQIGLFSKLFEKGDKIMLSEVKDHFYSEIGAIKNEIKDNLKNHQFYDEGATKTFHSGKLIAAFVLMLTLGILSIALYKFVLTGALFIIGGIIFLIYHFQQPKLSDKGHWKKTQVEQFKKTMENPNQAKLSQILKKDPKYFEKIYPYAVALGFDNKLVEAFEPILETAPTWYHNNQKSTAVGFADFKSSFKMEEVKEAFVYNPSSSSGSSGGGFSSSGSSGGGYGGGGGSSW